MRASASAATASSAPTSSARTGRCCATTASASGSRCASSDMASARKPKLAVWKFASCDGCQLSLLDCEDELLARRRRGRHRLLPRGHAAAWRRARTTCRWSKARSPRRTTPSASSRCAAQSKHAGHHRRLRHRRRHPGAAQLQGREGVHLASSTRSPDYIDTLATSTPIARSRRRSTSSCAAARSTSTSCWRCSAPSCAGRKPDTPAHSVCMECKLRGTVCVMVAQGTPCLGPVTHAGCGALCPAYNRGCYGCFGPMETPERRARWASSCATLGMHAARPAARLPHLQRPGRSRSARRASVMARKTINVDYLARVEGEGALHVTLQATARCATWSCSIFEPPRFFEAFLRGRALRRSARHHRAHLRHLPGRLPDERGARDGGRASASRSTAPLRALRRLLYCGEWIESHALHIYMLHAPDFLGYDERDRDGEGPPGRWSSAALQLKKAGNEILQLLGGREIHPINVRVGGFYRAPTRRELAPLRRALKRARDAALDDGALGGRLRLPRLRARLRVRRAAASRTNTRSTRGAWCRTRASTSRAREYDAHFEEQHVAHSNALHSRHPRPRRLPGRPAGALQPELRPALAAGAGGGARGRPRHRSATIRSAASWCARWRCCTPATRRCASSRRYEEPDAARRAESRRAPAPATPAPRRRAACCTTATALDADGTIPDAKIVPPTSQNQPSIEDDLRAFLPALAGPAGRGAALALRAGDPQLRPVHLLRHPFPEAGGGAWLARRWS